MLPTGSKLCSLLKEYVDYRKEQASEPDKSANLLQFVAAHTQPLPPKMFRNLKLNVIVIDMGYDSMEQEQFLG